MVAINYVKLPLEATGRDSLYDEGNAVTVYLDIHTETYPSVDETPDAGLADTKAMSSQESGIAVGFPIRCEKPISRASLINAAEAQVYGLKDASATASFNASLARKFREDKDDEEVKEHDRFINWVKKELTKVGIK